MLRLLVGAIENSTTAIPTATLTQYGGKLSKYVDSLIKVVRDAGTMDTLSRAQAVSEVTCVQAVERQKAWYLAKHIPPRDGRTEDAILEETHTAYAAEAIQQYDANTSHLRESADIINNNRTSLTKWLERTIEEYLKDNDYQRQVVESCTEIETAQSDQETVVAGENRRTVYFHDDVTVNYHTLCTNTTRTRTRSVKRNGDVVYSNWKVSDKAKVLVAQHQHNYSETNALGKTLKIVVATVGAAAITVATGGTATAAVAAGVSSGVATHQSGNLSITPAPIPLSEPTAPVNHTPTHRSENSEPSRDPASTSSRHPISETTTSTPTTHPTPTPIPSPSTGVTSSNENEARSFVFGSEGGYSNHPNDRGGRTLGGVTQTTYNSYRASQGLPHQDVRNMGITEHNQIFHEMYWAPIQGDRLSMPVATAMADFAFHSGPSRAIRELQTVLGVTSDGVLGPATFTAMTGYRGTQEDLANAIVDRRETFQQRIITRDPSQQVFARGWHNRNERLREQIQSYQVLP